MGDPLSAEIIAGVWQIILKKFRKFWPKLIIKFPAAEKNVRIPVRQKDRKFLRSFRGTGILTQDRY